jgi:hypothetical protein
MTNLDNQLKAMLNRILGKKGLTIYQKMALITIHTKRIEHGSSFPSYDTIASCGSMSRRKAIYVVKELGALNELDKMHRFTVHDMQTKQLSNVYDAPCASVVGAGDAPYKDLEPRFKDLRDLKKEEEDINKTHNLTVDISKIHDQQAKSYGKIYSKVFNSMVEQQAGCLSFKDEAFLDACMLHNLPGHVVEAIYEPVKNKIGSYHLDAIASTFKKFSERLQQGKIKYDIPKWFETAYCNENIIARANNHLSVPQEMRSA